MENSVIYGLALAILFFSGAQSATFTFTNNCPFTIWPGALSGAGSPPLSSTGFELASKAKSTLTVQAPWSGRFWARTGCATDSTGKFTCETGDCGSGQVECKGAGGAPPASLVEFFLAENKGKDFYDVSLVDGFNLPVSVTPQGVNGCNSTSCPANVNAVCPPELQIKSSSGSIVGCKSACVAFNKPEYCCSGAIFGTPEKCPATNYSQIFKKQCPQAYSYAYDDKTSTVTCIGGADYFITFCP